MLMSQSARSASVTGLPNPGVSAAAVPMPQASTKATAAIRGLRVDMLRLPFAVDRPAGDDVHVPHRECGHRHVDLGLAALGEHFGTRRLHVAGLIPGTALQD